MGQEIKPLALLEHATCKDSIHMFDEEKFIPGGISDQKQMVDIELAILTERDSELTNIAGSMRQIRDIQKG